MRPKNFPMMMPRTLIVTSSGSLFGEPMVPFIDLVLLVIVYVSLKLLGFKFLYIFFPYGILCIQVSLEYLKATGE